ncbi:hypothetical protein GCM10010466_65610 [Planomonospora alba]|uniref:Uncharacterized protein n=1 Tax=Planomonospora alba TaxID=161354 RepID=A0ABP6P2V2_9ACTN
MLSRVTEGRHGRELDPGLSATSKIGFEPSVVERIQVELESNPINDHKSPSPEHFPEAYRPPDGAEGKASYQGKR